MRNTYKHLWMAVLLVCAAAGSGDLRADTSTTALPDLVIAGVTYSPASPTPGQWVNAQVTVKNQGPVQAIFRVGQSILSVKPAGFGDEVKATQDFIIPAGGTQSYTLTAVNPYTNRAPGTYSLVYTVNPAQLTTESNVANNSATYPLTLAAGQSAVLPTYDLAVESVKADPARGTTATEFVFTSLIKNRGNTKSYVTSIGCFDRMIALDKAQGLPRYLDPGQSFGFQCKMKLPAGLQNVNVTVNPSDTKGDADFANNNRIIQVEVVDPAIGSVGRPILKITRVYAQNGSTVKAGEAITVSGQFANCGDGSALIPGGAVLMQVTEGGRVLAAGSLSATDVVITPNCALSTYIKLPVGVLAPGMHTLLVTLDPKNVIQEKDENYHQSSLQVMVVGPDLAVNAVRTTTSTNPSTRDAISIEVSVKNLGPMPASFPAGSQFLSYGAQGFTSNKMILSSPLQLAPGQEFKTTLSAPPFTPNAGNYTLTVLVDPANSMGDANLNNNRASLPVTLIVPRITVTAPTGTTAPLKLPENLPPGEAPVKPKETKPPVLKPTF